MADVTALFVLAGVIISYFIRIEKRLSSIMADLIWVKEFINKCQPRQIGHDFKHDKDF